MSSRDRPPAECAILAGESVQFRSALTPPAATRPSVHPRARAEYARPRSPTVAFPFCYLTLRAAKPLPRTCPQVLATIGDYLRKRRLDLGLLQREVAERLGVDHCTVTNWELNRTKPALRFLPGIIDLIGYDPRPHGASLGDRLKAARQRAGLSQQRLARLLGIDPATLSRWERNLRTPTSRDARLAQALLGETCRRRQPDRTE